MYFTNQHPDYAASNFKAPWFGADVFTDEEENQTRCNHCGKMFHGHQHEIRAIIHLASEHKGARN